MKKLVLLAICFFLSSIAFAHTKLPVFGNQCYVSAKLINIDNCSLNKYQYLNQQFGNPLEVARILLKIVPPRTDCKWTDVVLESSSENTPQDFIGSATDWKKIIENPKSWRVATWKKSCVNKSGKEITKISVVIQPSYICPVRTRYGYDINENRFGCSNYPVVCDADVAGRDNGNPQIAAFGHLGMTMFHTLGDGKERDFGVEALDLPHSINVQYFDTFRKGGSCGTKYWGARYSYNNVPYLTKAKATNIINYALDQAACDSSILVSGWDYTPCGSNPKKPKLATYRCDALVYDSFVKGASLHIVPKYKFPITPKDIFAAVKYCREKGSKCPITETLFPSSVSLLQEVLPPNQFLFEKQIRDLFIKQSLDVGGLDLATYNYVHSNNIARVDKINFLWQLALEQKDNEFAFNYLLSCLNTLDPQELTTTFIQTYFAQKSLGNKRILILLLANLAVEKNPATLDIIKQFFLTLANAETNPIILETIIFAHAHIFSAAEAKIHIDEIFSRQDIDVKKLRQAVYTNPAYFTEQLAMILSSFEMQDKYLKQLLDEVSANTRVAQQSFNNSLYYYFKDADYTPPKVGFDPSLLSDNSRAMLKNYLTKIRPITFIADHPPELTVGSSDYTQYVWLETYMSVQAKNEKEKQRLIAKYIANTQDPIYQALLLSLATKNVYAEFSHSDLESIHAKLENVLQVLNSQEFNSNELEVNRIEFAKKFIEAGIIKIDR